ncbi:hypothetical protein NDR87_05025 [Nocardia sp. CDC159]|uniref:Uncharacterized protein n=1 Tax=Nocardia pulmonis TaxID=2951408 RepID=A0A9X2E7K9_9NOCA|nr:MULTISPECIES: hypothetical protein [Nocardia]MCM6772978.1 hypothetical protein [Nocardia pulmonis]MCM6785719.1 hypothetical protein [Nocardia sp. CDC159]
MSEILVADPHEIAGLSNAVEEISHDGNNIAIFVGQCCAVDEGNFGGMILAPLVSPLRVCADQTRTRMGDIANQNAVTSGELNRAAWLYHGRDRRNYEALNAATVGVTGKPVAVNADRENAGFVRPYPDAAAYPKPEQIRLDPPSAAPPELADIIAETNGALGDVNDAIKNVTRMAGNEVDILATCLAPITTNWNELRRIGESYKVAGNAMEASGANLDDAVRRVGPKWGGRAAISFEDWAGKQIRAMKWEGPVGRVISDVCNEMADKIRDGVRRACRKLCDFVVSFVEFRGAKDVVEQLVKKIPGIGTAIEILDLARKIWDVVDLVRAILREIEEVRDRLKEFLEFVTNPAGRGRQWVEQKLEPYTSKIDAAAKKAILANDIARIGRVNDTLDRPHQGYDIGSGAQPWESAP